MRKFFGVEPKFFGQIMTMGPRCWCSWLVHVLVLLLVNQAVSSTHDRTIRIGYLCDDVARAGAINVAIEQAQNDRLLLDYNFRYYGYLNMHLNAFCSVMALFSYQSVFAQ